MLCNRALYKNLSRAVLHWQEMALTKSVGMEKCDVRGVELERRRRWWKNGGWKRWRLDGSEEKKEEKGRRKKILTKERKKTHHMSRRTSDGGRKTLLGREAAPRVRHFVFFSCFRVLLRLLGFGTILCKRAKSLNWQIRKPEGSSGPAQLIGPF